MKYILDESAIYYMLETFPRKTIRNIFDLFCRKCKTGEIISDKETKKRLESLLEEEFSFQWIEENAKMFRSITQGESLILGELVDKGRFEFVSKSGNFIRNIPIALPFIFSIALHENRIIVMDKKCKDFAIAKSICEEEEITLLDVDNFLSKIFT
ncbi:MAG: hypothetical protein NC094_08365 [Bacteroidales bacterium]|nr:hypothetical protein [Lachnoclostridium sp.]MCM1384027.1 hypothetical protein [Lachnoclostridium sp.]MCM1465417.1 hypothetical protein [Bacteroidales bacterium]